MSIAQPPIPFRRAGQKYAFVVVAVVFLALLVSAGLRSSPSVLLVPLEESFGWNRSTTSFAAAVGIFLYGLVGPFAAAAMERFGPVSYTHLDVYKRQGVISSSKIG